MYCNKCGTKLVGNEEYCPSCGTKIVKEDKNIQQMTTSEKIAINSKKRMQPIKKFIIKYRKQELIILSCLILILVGVSLFNKFYDFTKINWNKEKGDYNVKYTTPTTLNLEVLAFDKEKNQIKKIKFVANAGEIENKDNQVKWKLPQKEGKYKITAISPTGKKIYKEVSVLNLNEDNKELNGVIIKKEEDKTADNDNDGLTNEEEIKFKTNPDLMDSDEDGILDYYEINETKTDPLKDDTDGDGIKDGDELDLELNPLNSDSKGDGIEDGKRTLKFNIEDSKLGVTLDITGKGNIASSTIDVFKNKTFSSMKGMLDNIYNFYTTGVIEKAIVKIKYNKEEIIAKNLNEDNLTLYYFDDISKELKSLPTEVDKENNQIIVTLEHFSKYVIGDKDLVITNSETNILFVIDNSASMYSEKQMKEAGYSSHVEGNDSKFKRLSLSNKMVDMFTGNYNFGVSEFAGNYMNLLEFTKSQEKVKQTINGLKDKSHRYLTGTNIISALNEGVIQFENPDLKNYLILFTDGENNHGSLSNQKENIVAGAKKQKVKICVIGLGDKINKTDLNYIATQTGCKYYHANNASALDEIYASLSSDINYNYVDTDDDHKVDGMIIEDTGFLANRDGFSFDNFGSNKSEDGHCYGMALFAMLYYLDKLPLSLGSKETFSYNSHGYNLNNTYFSKGGNLYNFKITDEYLKIGLRIDLPKGFWGKCEDGTLKISDKYMKSFENIGATFITINKEGETPDKEKFNKIIFPLLNIDIDTDNEKFKNIVSEDKRDDWRLLNAIWRLYIIQDNYPECGEDLFFYSSPDNAFEKLQNNLSLAIPQVLILSSPEKKHKILEDVSEFGPITRQVNLISNILGAIVAGKNFQPHFLHNYVQNMLGGHAVNAIKLIQDINDANIFKIEIYDNNYHGETHYIILKRSKISKWQRINILNIHKAGNAWNNTYQYQISYRNYERLGLALPTIE